jgi:hypothetical protein
MAGHVYHEHVVSDFVDSYGSEGPATSPMIESSKYREKGRQRQRIARAKEMRACGSCGVVGSDWLKRLTRISPIHGTGN